MSEFKGVDTDQGEQAALLHTNSPTRASVGNSGDDSSDHGDDRNTLDRSTDSSGRPRVVGVWTADEHERFLRGMQRFPLGPWSAVAAVVGTRSVRQVHSHAQKYAAKVERHKRGEGKIKRSEIAGGQGSPSGHRVVPKIPGKFYSQAEILIDRVDDHRMLEDDKKPGVDTEARSRALNSGMNLSQRELRADGFLGENSIKQTTDSAQPRKDEIEKPSSRTHTPESPQQRETRSSGPTNDSVERNSRRDGNGNRTVPPLPSFEESLDFLIMAFDETDNR